MSFFLDALQWIFGGKPIDQRNDEEATSRNRNTNSQISQSDAQTAYRSRFPPSISYSIGQSDAHEIRRESNSFNFPQTSITPTIHTSRGSTGNNNSPSRVSQNNVTNPLIIKPSDQGSQPNSSLFSSQSSSSSSSSKPSSSLSEPSAYSSKQSLCLCGSGLHQSLPKPTLTSSSTSSRTPSSSLKPPPPSTKPTLFPASSNLNNQQTKINYFWVEKGASPTTSSGTPSSSSKPPPPPPSTKPTLSLVSSNLNNQSTKTNYIWVEKGASPIYATPEDIRGLIEKDIVPGILTKPLSASTYKDYFDALLYAEDYYLEKWDGFEMENVTLKLHEAAIYNKKGKYEDLNKFAEKDDKIFVEFEIDSIPARRPFLLSRDFAFVRPSGRNVEPFQGIIYRVVKSNIVLVEFGEDFLSQHDSACKYDVKFSFNRVCLKRAHQAIAAASDPLFQNFLFPDLPRNSLSAFHDLPTNHKLDREQASAVQQILSLVAAPPYLVEGPLSVVGSEQLSRTGIVLQVAVIQIYRTSPSCRILICAPLNKTCDVLMRGLKKEIPESKMFRANAAFRELDGVPIDILPSCLYKRECFSCPSLKELRKFKVILSTFMSSYRLHSEGIVAGHFSHIFLVDASSTTEPETMVALANLANEKTAVVVTGAPRSNHSRWMRSKIAKQNGLMTSYFDRLCESKLYKSLDPKFITRL